MSTKKTTGLNFIEAVQAAKETGCKIRRPNWIEELHWFIDRIGQIRSSEGCAIMAHIGHIRADDWEIVPDPPKTIRLMSFGEAMAKVKEGRAVRREDWVHSFIEKDSLFGIARVKTRKNIAGQWLNHFIPTFEEIEATDWVIVEEGQS